MVGIIVTGHGNFASGILSSLKVIAGEQEKLLGVDFTVDDSTESLEIKLQEAIENLSCEEVLVLSDLAGGSPFKVSVMLSQKLSNNNIRVISGTNLGMILETSLCRDGMGVDDLVEFSINSGVSSIKAFELKAVEDEDVEEIDGI